MAGSHHRVFCPHGTALAGCGGLGSGWKCHWWYQYPVAWVVLVPRILTWARGFFLLAGQREAEVTELCD